MSSSRRSICRTSRIIFSIARLPTDREVSAINARLDDEIVTVIGGAPLRSMTRANVHLVLSNSNGGRAHQPWLITVRRKLKSGGVGIGMRMIELCKLPESELVGK